MIIWLSQEFSVHTQIHDLTSMISLSVLLRFWPASLPDCDLPLSVLLLEVAPNGSLLSLGLQYIYNSILGAYTNLICK